MSNNSRESQIDYYANVAMRPKTHWAIDSEAMSARGIIIILVKSNYVGWSKK